jgi:DNA anti-recombination protein RmuC
MSTVDIKAKAEDIKNKAQDIKNNMNQTIAAQRQKMNESLENVQNQLSMYGTQIRDYLNNMEADIESYRFAVEKLDNGLSVDVLFKATIRTKET